MINHGFCGAGSGVFAGKPCSYSALSFTSFVYDTIL